jgi:2-polyprenyl-3-methyl-5-hydroxy-6-metoxy-1,4-benzoquinol methylase
MKKASHTRKRRDTRRGAKQPQVFNPARAALLDSPDRFEYLVPDRIFAHLDPPQGGLVVDFGAGTGAFSIELAQRRPDLKVIALDEQPEMLKLLEAKPAAQQLPNVRPMLVDEVDSLKGAADRILAMNVLHELGDATLRGISRLLKPQGSLLIVDWNSAVDRPVGPPKDHTHTPGEALTRLAKAGFEAISLEPLRYHFVLRAKRKKAKPLAGQKKSVRKTRRKNRKGQARTR